MTFDSMMLEPRVQLGAGPNIDTGVVGVNSPAGGLLVTSGAYRPSLEPNRGNAREGDLVVFIEVKARRGLTYGRPADAVAALLEFPLVHPDSYLADRALMAAARIQSEQLGDDAAAGQTLARLLAEYPGSLLASEARTMVRRLRGEGT